ncbi:uncharacterized protein LOC129179010 [Dunckerocampus dactyliophorus]|uniref:uncharacterized protein LOC129179010 n=1 Tax=Dunckerocampus dactyliophorus TaxID=161453 RepID=UPI0024061BFF|nr:uncharacterized protein LOC129179010 [Dunckerocampus dactyliophorus]
MWFGFMAYPLMWFRTEVHSSLHQRGRPFASPWEPLSVFPRGYRPQSNGQTKRANQSMESALSFSFQPPLFPSQESGSTVSSVATPHHHGHWVWRDTQAALSHTAKRNQRLADRRHKPAPEYQPGQKIWLSSCDLSLAVDSKKLAPRYIGPFKGKQMVRPSWSPGGGPSVFSVSLTGRVMSRGSFLGPLVIHLRVYPSLRLLP